MRKNTVISIDRLYRKLGKKGQPLEYSYPRQALAILRQMAGERQTQPRLGFKAYRSGSISKSEYTLLEHRMKILVLTIARDWLNDALTDAVKAIADV